MNRIALGTVQFGLDYGINNRRGQIPPDEVSKILDLALASGIDTLDTAAAYGESERIIGDYMKRSAKEFRVISKLPKCSAAEVNSIVSGSLNKLNLGSLYGYLIHNFMTYEAEPALFSVLKESKEKGKITKIGFSLYYPAELEAILERGLECDLVQVPYSVLDQRFTPFFPLLKEKGIEIHTRSVFLQGLLFKRPEELTGIFLPITDKIAGLRSLSERSRFSLAALLVNFALANEYIDRVVIGVDGIDNLRELVAISGESHKINGIIDDLKAFKEDDEGILLPFNWEAEAVR